MSQSGRVVFSQMDEVLFGTPAAEGEFSPGMHSVVTDPRNPDVLLVGVSTAGVFESRDGGKTWRTRNQGLLMDYSPNPGDEWAADQDPRFKDVFYTRLLPELKGRGKAVVVISHDEQYFHLADRVVKLDYGTVSEVRLENDRAVCNGTLVPTSAGA